MFHYQTLTGLPKHCPKKLNQAPYIICYTQNMTTYPKGKSVETTNLQPGELIHMEFVSYNVTSLRVFPYIITVVCTKTTMLWISPTEYKLDPFSIIIFILTTFNNEQHPCKCVRVDEDVTLENSTDVTNSLVDEFVISMETNGVYPTKYHPT